MAKALIYYHRAYRKITGSGRVFLYELMAICLPLSLLILFAYPLITVQMSHIAQAVLSSYYTSDSIKVIDKAFLLGKVSYISVSGLFPSKLFSIINLVISFGMIVILPRVKRNKNIAIYIVFLAGINLLSSIFFSLDPNDFPYSATDFSELYVKAEIGMWLFIPFILGMAFLPLPAPLLPKLLLIAATLVYSLVFGTLRYVIFIFIVSKLSILYMALLFFAFGPLIDFVYIVGIYCFYNSKLAHNLKGSESVWKWSY
jgi:hypothetical protein